MEESRIKDAVQEAIKLARDTGVEPAENNHLEKDLKLDSLDRIEAVMILEEMFSIDLPPDADNAETVGDLINIVKEAVLG